MSSSAQPQPTDDFPESSLEWAHQLAAAETLARIVEAANRGRWTDLAALVGPGRLLVRDGADVLAYDLPSIARAHALAMRTRWATASATLCATLAGRILGAEVVTRLPPAGRFEVALCGAIVGPSGRLRDVYLEADDESPVRAWLDGLGVAPLLRTLASPHHPSGGEPLTLARP
jgi:hypothetical protein